MSCTVVSAAAAADKVSVLAQRISAGTHRYVAAVDQLSCIEMKDIGRSVSLALLLSVTVLCARVTIVMTLTHSEVETDGGSGDRALTHLKNRCAASLNLNQRSADRAACRRRCRLLVIAGEGVLKRTKVDCVLPVSAAAPVNCEIAAVSLRMIVHRIEIITGHQS